MLNVRDKEVIRQPGGMLCDRHIMYAANELLTLQHPSVSGMHSTLLVQKRGFPPVAEDGNLPRGVSHCNLYLFFIYIYIACDSSSLLQDYQHHTNCPILSTLYSTCADSVRGRDAALGDSRS